MKKRISLLILTLAASTFAAGVPNQITYQGSLKEAAVPVNAARNMQFRLTNQDGSTAYWSSGSMPVNVVQGLFAVVLAPTGVDWQNITPYIEVSVEGRVLLPREPVSSNAYALVAGSVVDGSNGVPSGMIALFAGNCPAGWMRFAALDNAFPMGGSAYGALGGSATHSHTLLEGAPVPADGPMTVGAGSPGGVMGAYSQGSANFVVYPTRDVTTSASSLPPYLTVVYCQKS